MELREGLILNRPGLRVHKILDHATQREHLELVKLVISQMVLILEKKKKNPRGDDSREKDARMVHLRFDRVMRHQANKNHLD